MIGALLAAALAAAPGCPAALARAAALPDGTLAGEAAALVQALEEAGAGGPTGALRAEARAAASGTAAGARFRAALVRHCALAGQRALPPPDPGDRDRAAEILARPEFRRARVDPDAVRRWLLALRQRILDLLETGEAQEFAAASRAVFFLAAALAGLGGLLALRRRRAPRARPTAAPAAALTAAPIAGLAPAEEAVARGEHGRAVRLALLAALAALEREGAVPPGRALTNRELTGLIGDPGRAGALRDLSRLFDRTVYGGVQPGPSDARAALAAARALSAGEVP